jgi:hypothetical protein
MHQLPGVTSCASHGINLIVYLWTSTCADRQRLLSVPYSSVSRSCHVNSSPRQIWFAKLSRDFLHAGLPVLSLQQKQRAYESAVSSLGFSTKARRIKHEDLADAVRTYYDDFDGFIHKDRLLSSRHHPLAWLRTLLDRPSRASHPICHLLLIGFLFKTLEGFLQALRESGYIGVECCDRQNVHSETASTREAEERADLLLKNVTVSCREASRILGLSVTTVVSRRRAMGVPIAERRKSLNAGKLREITKALKKGLPVTGIATRNRVSVATVYRIRVESKDLLNTHVWLCEDRERTMRRRVWMQALERHQNVGQRELRTTDQATYTWLYRHDRTWLQEACKALHCDRKTVKRVDWVARDIELCRRIEELANNLLLRHDRPRISRSILLRAIGEAMVRRNLEQLPKLNASLEALVESRQAFQIYRIERAIMKLTAQGLPIQLWRIQRLGGIKKWTDTLRFHAGQKISSAINSLKTVRLL